MGWNARAATLVRAASSSAALAAGKWGGATRSAWTLQGAVRRYGRVLEERPVVGNLVTGALLGLTGDLVCQLGVEGKTLRSMDMTRLVGMTSFSGFYAGCVSLHVFNMYPRILPAWALATKWREGFVSSVADCIGHSPLLYLPVFYVWTGFVRGDSLAECAAAYKAQFVPVMKSLLLVWIPVQAINFSVVPRSYRVVFVCAANLVWNCLLDYLAHNTARS